MLELETQTPPPPPKNWFVGHPYAASSIGAVLLFLVGLFVVLSNSLASPPPPSVAAWGGSLLSQIEYAPGLRREESGDILQQVQDSPPYSYKIPPLTPTPTQPPTPQPANELDLDSFFASIDAGQNQLGTAPRSWSNVLYEYPPSTIFSAEVAPPERSELQQKLYNYGNEVGSYIQSFEQQNSNQTQVLKDQVEDRDDPQKAEAVVLLGRALQNIGRNMRSIDDVPPQIADAHEALIQSYTEIGYNLTLVPNAKDTKQFLDAITAYNLSADSFAEKFVDMVGVFAKYNVAFTSRDAGSVFTFTFTSEE